MNGSDEPDSNIHPLDVRSLLQDGKIAAVRVQDNTVPVDRDVFDVLIPRLALTPTQQAVYMQMYRHSYGRGLNCAQLSNSELQKLCNVTHSTVRSSIRKLTELGILRLVRAGVQHDACIYRVYLPSEILNYDSATRIDSRNLEADMLLDRLSAETPPKPVYERPVLNFNKIRATSIE